MLPALATLPWRYIGPAAGVLAILTLAYCTGRSDGGQRAKAALAVERANVAALETGLATQNAGIAAQGKAAAVVAKASQKAIRSGAERRGALDARAAAVAAVRPSAGQMAACGAVPDDVRALWEAM